MDKQEDQIWPPSAVEWITGTFGRFLKIEAVAAVLLIGCALIALLLSNSRWTEAFLSFWQMPIGLGFGSFDFTRSLQSWVNDGLMTLFFFVVSLELKRELVLGELRHRKAATLPLVAAMGGMIVPALTYTLVIDGRGGSEGWGIVMATDTAFVIGCLALFGRTIPPSLRVLLVSLAIFDDLGSIAVITIVYAETLNYIALVSAILVVLLTYISARVGVRSMAVYVSFGVVIWLALDESGIHATLAGVILGIMTPTRPLVKDARLRSILSAVLAYPKGEHWSGDTRDRADLKIAGRAISEALSPLERLELALHPWVGFTVLPIFALANAGVSFSWSSVDHPLLRAIIAGLVLGKPAGILLFIWIALRLRFATLSKDLNWQMLLGGAFLTGIGFTMSLFIAELALSADLASSAKSGIFIGSVLAASLGLATLVVASKWHCAMPSS